MSGRKAITKSGIGTLFDVGETSELLVGLTIPILLDLMKNEGQAQLERLNTTEPFNPKQWNCSRKVIRRRLRLASESYVSTTLQLLNNSLGEGVAEGESIAKLTWRVSDVFSLTDNYRAERIALTVVFQTANTSAREAYIQSGVVKEVRRHTAKTNRPCEYITSLWNGKQSVFRGIVLWPKRQTVRGRDLVVWCVLSMTMLLIRHCMRIVVVSQMLLLLGEPLKWFNTTDKRNGRRCWDKTITKN